VSGLADAYVRWRQSALGHITERLEHDLVLELAGPLAGRRVLDAGVGDGAYAIEAATRGARVLGIDVDTDMLEAARQRADARGVELGVMRAPVEAIPAADGAFDVVLAVTVLCFVEEPRAALRELARVLAPGGRLVLGELARWSSWGAMRRVRGWFGDATWRRVHLWTRRELIALVESAGLRVTDVRGAVHYPKATIAARVFAPIDPLLGRMHAPGAAFLAISADKERPA